MYKRQAAQGEDAALGEIHPVAKRDQNRHQNPGIRAKLQLMAGAQRLRGIELSTKLQKAWAVSLGDRQDLSAELRGPTVAVGWGGNVGHGRVRPDGSLQQNLRAVGHGIAAPANLQRQIQQQGMQRTGGCRQGQLLQR